MLVRERLTAGDNDREVFAFVVARYGEYVLLKPPLNPSTLLLWLTPFLVLAGASFFLYRSYRRRMALATKAEVAALSAEEKAALDRLLASSDDDVT